MEPTNQWRLIRTKPAAGAWNMAVDEAILQAAGQNLVPPTLRLYAWDPPCLSLGYAQPFSDVNIPALEENGWDLARRPTGGRSVLHTDELTYSIIAPNDEPIVKGGVLASYKRISKALLNALDILGLPARADREYNLPLNGSRANDPICFKVPSNYEITVGGKKLIGSAQARRSGGVLQHGSLPLFGEITRIVQVLMFASDEHRRTTAERLVKHATTVELCLNQQVSWENAASAFETAFQQTLDINLVPSNLTPHELHQADILSRSKHTNSEWLQRL